MIAEREIITDFTKRLNSFMTSDRNLISAFLKRSHSDILTIVITNEKEKLKKKRSKTDKNIISINIKVNKLQTSNNSLYRTYIFTEKTFKISQIQLDSKNLTFL